MLYVYILTFIKCKKTECYFDTKHARYPLFTHSDTEDKKYCVLFF